ncbi:fumarylacetoacetate hydrolase [Meredithblackwellia eburnea MCA 4105]
MTKPSRVIRFKAKEDGKVYYGEPIQDGDIGVIYHKKSLLTARILSASPLSSECSVTTRIATVDKLLSPLTRQEIGTIRGLGAQYGAPGTSPAKPETAIVFYKPLSALAGPEDPIFIPNSAKGQNNDYEVELCVVISKDVRDVSVEDALKYVGWYCVTNDVSSRGLCAKGVQWGIGKSFDSWCPIGPVLVASNLVNPQTLDLSTTVNGVVKQKSNTGAMILSVAEMISHMSQGVTIEAGSIILSGSPLPLDREKDANPWLKHGDLVQCEVQGLGTLINTVVEEGVQAKAKL